MNKQSRIQALDERFFLVFHRKPELHLSSPGRLELLGNHTDHNHGLVLVSAVDLDILASASKNSDNHVRVHSVGFADMDVDLAHLEVQKDELGQSASILRGVASFFHQKGYAIGGMDMVMDSAIFPGAGVSSSAAFELLICQAFNTFYNQGKIDPVEMAKIAQKTETDYFGKPCGLLDQMGVALGGVNYIDFLSTSEPIYKHVNFDLQGYTVILTNTGGSHANLTPLYKAIKDDMKKIAQAFGQDYLRDVPEHLVIEHKAGLIEKYGEGAYRRAIHFYNENKRVITAFLALQKKDAKKFVEMVQASGTSSRLYLKNTSAGNPKTEALSQGLALSAKLIKDGAIRVHGGGFAGTMLAFVKNEEAESYLQAMKTKFGPASSLIVTPRDTGVIAF